MCTSCHLRWSEREKLVLVLPLLYLTSGGVFDFVFVAFFVFVFVLMWLSPSLTGVFVFEFVTFFVFEK